MARFLFVSGHPRDEIERLAREHGVDRSEVVIVAAKREEVPALIAAADIGVSFILATFSAKASCPTKFGEMLAMGVPVIANAGVGDMAEIIRDTGAGAVVEDYDDVPQGCHRRGRVSGERPEGRARGGGSIFRARYGSRPL